MPFLRFSLAAILMAFASAANAEVTSASPSAFVIHAQATTTAPPARAWRALTHVERWWSSEHTYSGDARRLSLDPRAGGCWCERWTGGQSVEHARVVLVMERDGVRTLRVAGGFGPLQQMGAAGVLTYTVSAAAGGSQIEMTYRVSGDSGLALDQIAPIVDQVLGEQFGRLVRFSETGSPA